MKDQAIYAMSESILPQQQGLSKGNTKESVTVNFDSLIAQILRHTQFSTDAFENSHMSSELAELVQLISDINLQQDKDPSMDMDTIMSQLSVLFTGKVDGENVLHNIQELPTEKIGNVQSKIHELQLEKTEETQNKIQGVESNEKQNILNKIQGLQPEETKNILTKTQGLQSEETKNILNKVQGLQSEETKNMPNHSQGIQPEKIEHVLNNIQQLQPGKLEKLKNSIQNTIQQLEGIKSTEAKALKEKLGEVLEKITTYDLQKPDTITPNEELKQQSQLLSLVRSYKNSSDDSKNSPDLNVMNSKVMEPKTEGHEAAIPRKAEALEMKAIPKENIVIDHQLKETSKQPLNKQEFELALPIQRLEYKKTLSNGESNKAVEVVQAEPLQPAYGESEATELNAKPAIMENGLLHEDSSLMINKDNPNLAKIQNMDKIYMALQKQALQINGKEKSTLTVKLQPEELGNMKIQLEMVEGIVKGTIVVENEAAKQAVQNHLQEMKNQIKNQEISLESLEVNVESESFGESHQPADEENALFRQRHTMKNAFDGEVTERNAFANKSTYSDNTLNRLA